MASDIADVERALLALSPSDRAAVIRRGLRSLEGDGTEDGRHEADVVELADFRRRIDEIDDSRVLLVSGEESRARVRALLTQLNG